MVEGSELGGLGGAMGTAVGTGTYETINEAVENMFHLRTIVYPDEKQVDVYEKKYQMYIKLLDSLDSTWKDLKIMQEGIG